MQRVCTPPKPAKESCPDELLGRAKPLHLPSASDQHTIPSIQSETAVAEFPYFFGSAAAELLQFAASIHSRHLLGRRTPRIFSSLLPGRSALIVDRRKKRITTYRTCPLWAQPSYILLGREGTIFVRLAALTARPSLCVPSRTASRGP